MRRDSIAAHLKEGSAMRIRRRVTVIVAALTALLVVAGCASQQTAQGPEPAASPSETYLETEPPSGWIRSVGHDDGFVLVFETPERFDASRGWEYRLTLFNESGSDVTWDGLGLGVEGVADGAPWEGFSMGLGGPHQTRPVPPVTLRSGESTTTEVSQILQDPPLVYEALGVAQTYGANTWFRRRP
jgi:hypothetical protein